MMKLKIREAGVIAASSALALFASTALAGEGKPSGYDAEHHRGEMKSELSGAARDAWLQGKLETVYLLNRHLNPFSIDTEVKNGIAYLSGTVESDIDRALAEEIAEGVDGIVKVESDLEIDPDGVRHEVAARMESDADGKRGFARWVDDSTTTAAVKTALIAEGNIKARDINIDTRHDVVTLTGMVRNSEEKQLAEQIARNTSDVRAVNNQLTIGPQ